MKNKTDNDHFKHKVKLRLEAIENLQNVNVLDCFHGEGIIWDKIKSNSEKKIIVTGIEKEYGKGKADIYGDCNKVLPNLDLSVYNVIDIDSYGLNSLVILNKIIEKKYKGIAILTVIQSGYGRTNHEILKKIGCTDYQIKEANILISRDLENIIKKYIYSLGIQEIKGYFCGRKNYFYCLI